MPVRNAVKVNNGAAEIELQIPVLFPLRLISALSTVTFSKEVVFTSEVGSVQKRPNSQSKLLSHCSKPYGLVHKVGEAVGGF
jgi:hypothetical protein